MMIQPIKKKIIWKPQTANSEVEVPYPRRIFPTAFSPLEFFFAAKLFMLAFFLGLFFENNAFSVPPVPDWLRTRLVKRDFSQNKGDTTSLAVSNYEPSCPPHLCLEKEPGILQSLNEEHLRDVSAGIQKLSRDNYKLRTEVRIRWMGRKVEGKAGGG